MDSEDRTGLVQDALAGDQATAACTAASQSSDDVEPRAWSVTLKRTDVGWAINSIQSS